VEVGGSRTDGERRTAETGGPRVLTARLMRGASAGLVCGLVAVGTWAAAITSQLVLLSAYAGLNFQSFGPGKQQMPSLPLVIGVGVTNGIHILNSFTVVRSFIS
jgi:hypothetical protein